MERGELTLGVEVESASLGMEGLRPKLEASLDGGEVVRELLPEGSAAADQLPLTLQLREARLHRRRVRHSRSSRRHRRCQGYREIASTETLTLASGEKKKIVEEDEKQDRREEKVIGGTET